MKIESENYRSCSDDKGKEEIRRERYGTTSRNKNLNPSKETSRLKLFTSSEIQEATNDFSESSKIGKGGYGSVYRCCLDDIEVAIKMPDANGSQGLVEFIQELDVLGDMYHPKLVRLIGVCLKLRSLVYEFIPNGSLEYCLKERAKDLTWKIRTRIIFEICSVLIFLHSENSQPMVHGDIKPHNILLDANFNIKLSDFGLSRFMPKSLATATATDLFHQTKNIRGTEWYIDPDFLESGKLTPSCDVYAFGITILRILTGAPTAEIRWKVKLAFERKTLMTIVDPSAGYWPDEVAKYLARIGLGCCEPDRKCSTLMKDISSGLKGILDKFGVR